MRKVYEKPVLRRETLACGVFGSYGGGDDDDGGGCLGSFIGFFNPLFGLCCGGGGG